MCFFCSWQAWRLHIEDRSLELVAKCLDESNSMSQVLRSIHVALLCVQCDPKDRPPMASAILMLESEALLHSPKEPGFYIGTQQDNVCSSSYETSSNNELSFSILNGR